MTNNENGNSKSGRPVPTSFQLTRSDGFTTLVIPDESFETIKRESKGKPTGVIASKFGFNLTETWMQANPSLIPLALSAGGVIEALKKVSVVVEHRNPADIEAKANAKRFRNLAADLRKRTGLTRGKVEIKPLDKITLPELQDWMSGHTNIDGYNFNSLPQETQDKITGLATALEDKQNKPKKLTNKEAMEMLLRVSTQPGFQLSQEELELIKITMKPAIKKTANVSVASASV